MDGSQLRLANEKSTIRDEPPRRLCISVQGLKAGHRIPGPAVITQADSSTLILPDHYGEVDPYLNILIWPNGGRAKRRGKTVRQKKPRKRGKAASGSDRQMHLFQLGEAMKV